MSNANAYGNYLKQEVEGASQGQLIVMLYDAAIRFMRNAVAAIGEKQIEHAHNNIIRAEEIIYELMSTLNTDAGGELADHLLRLYDFMLWELIEANNAKNSDKLNNVINLMTPLKEAWKEAIAKESETLAQQNQQTQVKPAYKQPEKASEPAMVPPTVRLNISG